MGTWSENTFGNDAACDWIGSFIESPGLRAVSEAIGAVHSSEGFLDSHEACNGLAACEVIARLQGRWGIQNSYSKNLDQWVAANPMPVPESLKTAADSAIERILSHDSELLELWDGDGRSDKWHKAIDDLRERIRG